MGPRREQPSTNPVAVHPSSIRSPPSCELSWRPTTCLPTAFPFFFFFERRRRRRIIFGYVFPLLIFTGYSGAKKIPLRKEKGLYEEDEMNGSQWKAKRNGLKILFMGAFKTYIVAPCNSLDFHNFTIAQEWCRFLFGFICRGFKWISAVLKRR